MQKVLGLVFFVLIGAGLSYVIYDRSVAYERATGRRLLETRAAELTARALTQGSPLACLDGAAGDAIETACEQAVFARPETAAAAVSYVTARLDLLADGLDYARKTDAGFEKNLGGLRRAAELDRYGIAAHVLATRDVCTPDKCAAFAWVSDARALKANMRNGTFANYVARHEAAWANPETPATPATPPLASVQPPSSPTAPQAPSARYDFPSAASIPPVSIMNAEPKAAASQASEPADDEAPKPAPARRRQTPAATPQPAR